MAHLPSAWVRMPFTQIRRWRRADAPLLVRAVQESIEHLRPWLWWAQPGPDAERDRREFIDRSIIEFDDGEAFHYGIFNRADDQVLGGIGLHPRGEGCVELGYWRHVAPAGRGLVTGCVGSLLPVAFSIDGTRGLLIRCDAANHRSAGVAERLGFRLERETDAPIRAPGETGREQHWVLTIEGFDPAELLRRHGARQ